MAENRRGVAAVAVRPLLGGPSEWVRSVGTRTWVSVQCNQSGSTPSMVAKSCALNLSVNSSDSKVSLLM